ncbi:hypothetical protein D9613_002470 [Agrocybe pediades]|uniref:Uncharacterized protein n=1 Tax=Agrocybe pediades TaxID=84607 RepID=A0A8H4QNU3_9AGAR|nr:hypothetical protein D9613_002470 [Agrocybe pediades]
MIFRVSSMYNHDRGIILLLATGFVLEWLGAILIQVLSYGVHAPIPNPAPGVRLCSQKSFPHWMFAVWIPIACFEGLILFLSICRGVTYYKSSKESKRLGLTGYAWTNSLGYILLRDSIAFPFICVSICFINLFVWIYLPHLAAQMAFCIASFAPCIIGPRLILNLREAYYQPFIQEINGQYDGPSDLGLSGLAGPYPSWADPEPEQDTKQRSHTQDKQAEQLEEEERHTKHDEHELHELNPSSSRSPLASSSQNPDSLPQSHSQRHRSRSPERITASSSSPTSATHLDPNFFELQPLHPHMTHLSTDFHGRQLHTPSSPQGEAISNTISTPPGTSITSTKRTHTTSFSSIIPPPPTIPPPVPVPRIPRSSSP